MVAQNRLDPFFSDFSGGGRSRPSPLSKPRPIAAGEWGSNGTDELVRRAPRPVGGLGPPEALPPNLVEALVASTDPVLT
jgi:hypothetical protein